MLMHVYHMCFFLCFSICQLHTFDIVSYVYNSQYYISLVYVLPNLRNKT